MDNVREFEPIWLFSLEKVLKKFVALKNANLNTSYKLVQTRPSVSSREESLDEILFRSTTTLTNELLVLATENYNKEGFDLSSPEFRRFLSKSKELLPVEMKNMNGTEFLKAIRDSIAHNSNESRNLDALNLDIYSVVLRKKGVANPATRTFTVAHLVKVLDAYDECRKLDQVHGEISLEDEYCSPVGLLLAKKKFGSFNSVLEYKNQNGDVVPMDEYQEKALLQFLKKHKNTMISYKCFPQFLARFYPCRDNKNNQYENKFCFMSILKQLYGYYNEIDCNKVINFLKSNDIKGILPFIDSEYLDSIIYSSIAFNIFSKATSSELLDLAKKAGVDKDEDTLRHTRNALIHGRYFYNFAGGFELYDGRGELEHIDSLKNDDIVKLYLEASKNSNIEIEKRRQETINKIVFGTEEPPCEK